LALSANAKSLAAHLARRKTGSPSSSPFETAAGETRPISPGKSQAVVRLDDRLPSKPEHPAKLEAATDVDPTGRGSQHPLPAFPSTWIAM
jgi:hypothetical protein